MSQPVDEIVQNSTGTVSMAVLPTGPKQIVKGHAVECQSESVTSSNNDVRRLLSILHKRSMIQHHMGLKQLLLQDDQLSCEPGQQENHLLSSVNLANRYRNTVHDLDLITDEDNIKQLLTLPYRPMGDLSMLIHRVGNTFLIDDLGMSCDLSTLIQQCVADTCRNEANDNTPAPLQYHENDENLKQLMSCRPEGKPDVVLIDRGPEKATPSMVFKRPAVWNFDSMKFLIGTSLPIFSSPTHPNVSVHLSDVRQPITVLTAIDCWLDNLICSVPELAMCFHLDGVMQRYDLIRTDEIPQIKGVEFSPKQIKTVALRLLQFLKDNATKQGHTYWLYKCPSSDKVRILDLTAHCFSRSSPIAKSLVGIMIRITNELIHSNEERTKYSKTIKSLASTCLSMVDQRQNPETFCELNFIMSHILINEYDSRVQPQMAKGVANDEITMQSLLLESKPILQNEMDDSQCCGSLHERATNAIKHITQALQTHFLSGSENHAKGHRQTRVSQKKQRADQRNSKRGLIYSLWYHSVDGFQRSQPLSPDAKALLILKASSAYYYLADTELTMDNFAGCLHYLQMCLECFDCGWDALTKLMIVSTYGLSASKDEMFFRFIELCGDCHMGLFVTMYKKNQGTSVGEIDQLAAAPHDDHNDKCILEAIHKYNEECERSLMFDSEFGQYVQLDDSEECAASRAIECYRKAISCAVSVTELSRRIVRGKEASVHNEYALFLLAAVERSLAQPAKEESDLLRMCERANSMLLEAREKFEAIGDTMGVVSTFCNEARSHRSAATISGPSTNDRFTKAIECYERALGLVKTERCKSVKAKMHESILADLCACLYQQASIYFESTISANQVDERRVRLLTKALKHVEPNPFQHDWLRSRAEQWAGELNHRLARHYQCRLQQTEHCRFQHAAKQSLRLVESYLKRALVCYQSEHNHSDNTCNVLRVAVDRTAVHTHSQPRRQDSKALKSLTRWYLDHLDILLDCCGNTVQPDLQGKEYAGLSNWWYDEITSTLKSIVRISCQENNESEKAGVIGFDKFKELYKAVLQLDRLKMPIDTNGEMYRELRSLVRIMER